MTDDQPTQGNARQQNRMRSRTGRILLILTGLFVLLVVLLIVVLFTSTPLHVSVETTYITEPLKSDGKQVDYFAAIEKETYPDNIATEENGFRLLVQHIVMASDSEPWHFARVCKKLGLNAHTIQPKMTYQEPFDFLKACVASKEFDETIVERLLTDEHHKSDPPLVDGKPDALKVLFDRTGTPWTFQDLPMMELWLKTNGPALDLVCKAVRKPTFHIPIARQSENDLLFATLLPQVQTVRSFARGLSARAHYRIGTGDIDGAIDDIMTCKRLGRHVGHGATVIDLLVGIAIEGVAGAIDIAGSLKHPPTKQQLQRLMDELDRLPPKAACDEKMRFERYTGLDALQSMAHGNKSLGELSGSPLMGSRYFSVLGLDWNIAARRLNGHYDAIIAGGTEPPTLSVSPMVLISRRARSKSVADVFGTLFVPALKAVQEAARRDQCAEQMKRITLAMLLYQCDHAMLPPAYSVDAEGNPLHSWRVLLLPYLKQDALYRKIRLDEPWSSEHNQKLHREDVACYRCPSVSTARPGQTTYSVVVGPDMPFEAGKGRKLTDFGPDSEDMILLVERKKPVCWLEPTREVPQSEAGAGINVSEHASNSNEPPPNGIASPHPGGANFGFRNGAVRFISETIDTDTFRKMLRGTNTVDDF